MVDLVKGLLKSSRIRSVCLPSMRDLVKSSTSSISCLAGSALSKILTEVPGQIGSNYVFHRFA